MPSTVPCSPSASERCLTISTPAPSRLPKVSNPVVHLARRTQAATIRMSTSRRRQATAPVCQAANRLFATTPSAAAEATGLLKVAGTAGHRKVKATAGLRRAKATVVEAAMDLRLEATAVAVTETSRRAAEAVTLATDLRLDKADTAADLQDSPRPITAVDRAAGRIRHEDRLRPRRGDTKVVVAAEDTRPEDTSARRCSGSATAVSETRTRCG